MLPSLKVELNKNEKKTKTEVESVSIGLGRRYSIVKLYAEEPLNGFGDSLFNAFVHDLRATFN